MTEEANAKKGDLMTALIGNICVWRSPSNGRGQDHRIGRLRKRDVVFVLGTKKKWAMVATRVGVGWMMLRTIARDCKATLQ